MHNRILFVATTTDLIALMKTIEAKKPLKYTLREFSDKPVLHTWPSFAKIENFGIIESENSAYHKSFIISEPDLEIRIDPVPQNKGGIAYNIATPLNPKTLLLKPGGTFQNDIVVSGVLMKYSIETEAKAMFGLFRREIKRQFKKDKDCYFWFGQEAVAMQVAGKRLTDDVRSPFSFSRENIFGVPHKNAAPNGA